MRDFLYVASFHVVRRAFVIIAILGSTCELAAFGVILANGFDFELVIVRIAFVSLMSTPVLLLTPLLLAECIPWTAHERHIAAAFRAARADERSRLADQIEFWKRIRRHSDLLLTDVTHSFSLVRSGIG